MSIGGNAIYGGTLTATVTDAQSGITPIYKWTDSNGDNLGNNQTCTVGKTQVDKTITVTVASKPYDGNTDAVISFAFADAVPNDAVSATASGAFADKNVGNGKTVTLTNFAFGDSWGSYYRYAMPDSTTANITAKAIAVTDGNLELTKVYDGTTAFTSQNVTAETALSLPILLQMQALPKSPLQTA